MLRRQSIPVRWLIVSGQEDVRTWSALRRLPRGSGVLLLQEPSPATARRMHNFASLRNFTLVIEGDGVALRVHDVRELRQALLQRTPILFLSPIYWTASHPDWRPLPRLRAAALACLAKRRLLALGGMDDRRYATLAQLGFIGWAGISAFRT